MRKMIRQIMTLATLCWMVAGCADEVIDRNGGKGEGRLLLTGIEVESAVSDVQTKASLAEGVIPTVSDFTITIQSLRPCWRSRGDGRRSSPKRELPSPRSRSAGLLSIISYPRKTIF